MSTFSVDAVKTLIKLRDELGDTLRCNYCNNVLEKARTLNCSHHVCEECAIKQMSHGSCKHCHCNYFKKDITNNICINNIVETFHDLSMTIEKAANLLHIKTDGKYKIDPSKLYDIHNNDKNDDESSSETDEEEEEEDEEQEEATKQRKRGREQDDINIPKAKKRRISPSENVLSHTPDTAMIDDMELRTNKSLEVAKSLESPSHWVPSQICITGYDKQTTARFEQYANALDIELNKKWSIGSTDMLISKSNISTNKPNITFKVLASILCDIPVVKENFLENSYEQNKILNHNKYICNYRRVSKQGLFEGLSILFATTNMPTERLRTLLSLGKANILETQQEIDNKDKLKFSERIMICAHETEPFQAKQLSKQYNCRVISESWVIKCIYPDDDDINHNLINNAKFVNYHKMKAITKRIDLDEFDQTLKSWDDEESSSEDDDDDGDDDGDDEEEHQINETY